MERSVVKSKLITRIAAKLNNLSVKDVEVSVNQIITAMTNALSNGKRIEIRGFGTFCLHYLKPRKARNPKTGETVLKLGRHAARFKSGKELRDRVNAKYGEPLS